MVNTRCMARGAKDKYADKPVRPDSVLPPKYDGGFVRIQNGHWMDTETGEVYTREGHNVATKRRRGLAERAYSILARITGIS